MCDTTTSGSHTSPLRKPRPAARAARMRGLGAGGIVRPGRGEPQPSGVKSSGWVCTDGVSLSAHRLTVPEAITRIRRCGNLYTVLAHLEPRLAKTRQDSLSVCISVQVHALISFTTVQATQGVRGCVRTERNKGCPHLKKRPGPDGPSIPHVMSGPVQKSQYPSQERAVIGGAAPQKSLILTENGPFPQNFGACGGQGAGAPRRRHTVSGLRPDGRNKGCPTPQERPRKLISRWTCMSRNLSGVTKIWLAPLLPTSRRRSHERRENRL